MQKTPVEADIHDIEDILEKYLDADSRINYALKIVGHPGIGKSSVVRQIAEKMNYYFMDTRLAFKENIDLGGYPVPDHENRRMVYYRPQFIPPEEVPEGYNGILWFLDEANRAHPTVIQTLFQIVTEHTCGEHKLPENTSIVMAGNLGEDDHTTITEFDDSALDGRLAIFHLKPSASAWLNWAQKTNIHPAVMDYIALYPEKLWDEIHVHPNPRGWHQVSQAISLSYGLDTTDALAAYFSENQYFPENQGSTLEKVIQSLIGEITAIDFVSQVVAPREISTHEILSGNTEKLEKIKNGTISSEDFLWSVSGAISEIRKKRVLTPGSWSPEDLTILANLLRFIGFSRADTRMSFFYLLLKECGVFTQIPPALETLTDETEKAELKKRFTRLIKPN